MEHLLATLESYSYEPCLVDPQDYSSLNQNGHSHCPGPLAWPGRPAISPSSSSSFEQSNAKSNFGNSMEQDGGGLHSFMKDW